MFLLFVIASINIQRPCLLAYTIIIKSGVQWAVHTNTRLPLWSSLHFLTLFQFPKKFPVFYGTWRFITTQTSPTPGSLSPRPQSPVHTLWPYFFSDQFLILSHTRPGFYSSICQWYFPINILQAFSLHSICLHYTKLSKSTNWSWMP
jgi:hypothetical protein